MWYQLARLSIPKWTAACHTLNHPKTAQTKLCKLPENITDVIIKTKNQVI